MIPQLSTLAAIAPANENQVWDRHVYSAILKMNNQGPAEQHMEPCSVLYSSLDGRESGEKWIHVYVWLRPFTVHLKLSQHCYLDILQYKGFKK